MVQEICVSNIFDKMVYISRPDENDKQTLKLFFGEKAMNHLIIQAHQSRIDLKNRPNYREEIKKAKIRIQEGNNVAHLLMEKLSKEFGNKLKSNKLITDLIVNFPTIQVI